MEELEKVEEVEEVEGEKVEKEKEEVEQEEGEEGERKTRTGTRSRSREYGVVRLYAENAVNTGRSTRLYSTNDPYISYEFIADLSFEETFNSPCG